MLCMGKSVLILWMLLFVLMTLLFWWSILLLPWCLVRKSLRVWKELTLALHRS